MSFFHQDDLIKSVPFKGGFVALSDLVHQWWEEKASPFRLMVLSDSLMVQRLLYESPFLVGLTGNEPPAGRKRQLHAWQENPHHKGLIRQADLAWMRQTHPDLLQSIGQATPCTTLDKEIAQQIRIRPLPFQWKHPLCLAPQVEGQSTVWQVLVYVLGNIPPYQRPQWTVRDRQAVLFQENATLESLFKVEDEIRQERLTYLLCDTTILNTLRLPVSTKQGKAIQYDVCYESTKGSMAWQAVAHSLNWHRVTHHPHEWWRWW